MARTIVGVLRGGTSPEYDLSIKTGAVMLNALSEDTYDTRDILIDKRGMWHSRGFPVDPARAVQQVDVVLNGLHGGVGEDGTVQRILEQVGVPYVGSSPRASALSLNKIRAAEILQHAGIVMPQTVSFHASHDMGVDEMARSVFAQFGPPYIVKPAREGASHGIQLAHTIIELPSVLADVLDAFGDALVQEFVRGSEATVGMIDDFRGEEIYALPPAQITFPAEASFLHFDHHTEGLLKHLVPAEFSHEEKAALVDAAKQAHRALGLSHYSRADFILTRRGPYLLEVNALPGLHEHAAFPPMLESVGSSMADFLGHVVGLARR
mgnify:CR=1 FL=1